MRKKLLLMGLVMSVVAMAAPVTLEQAQQRAQQFMARRGTAHNMRLAKQQLRIEQAQQNNAYYYVFNVGEQQGFVIVSGDDRTPDILGYADSGSFSDQDMPDNMRAWLQGYEDQMKWMEETGYQAPSRRIVGARSSINPLITTMWDQGKPYDRETPIAGLTRVNDQNGNLVRIDTTFCVTGCVATAMAQIMYYHHWPVDATTDIPGYSNSGYNTKGSTLPSPSNDLPSTTFDWTKIRNTYTNDHFAPELAKLMRYCGQAVQMHYSPNESGASTPNVISALKEYFDYDNTANYISRENYTAAQWADIIYAELQEERPVLYSGSSSGGGHAFIVDGYSEDEYYHINWGWSGRHNGYFLLSVLNPYANNESGASSSKDGYSFSQGAAIGVQPQQGTLEPTPAVVMTTQGLTAESSTYDRNDVSEDFTMKLIPAIFNMTGETHSFDIGFALFNTSGEMLSCYKAYTWENLSTNRGTNSTTFPVLLGANLADGSYLLENISREAGTDTWYEDNYARKYALKATITGNTITLEPLTTSLSGTDITASGTLETNNLITLNTTITNSGTALFNNYLYLFVDGVLAGGKMFEVEGKEIANFSIEYTPISPGEKNLTICTDNQGKEVIATGRVTISGSDVITDNIDLDVTYDLINRSGDKIMGNYLQVVANYTNNQDVNYSGTVYIYLHRKYSDGVYIYTGWSNVYREFSVPANSTAKFEYTFTDLDYDKTYNVEVKYIKAGSEVTGAGMLDNYLTPVEAYILYTTDGEKTYGETAADISTNASVAFADLRGQSTVQNVTSVANPNTIFMLDEEASLSGATNVIKNGVADKIELIDGYGFYTPVAFTATNISLNHTADKAFASGSGWETITLPFDVDAVSVNDEEIDWFHSSTDKGKNFWVMEFSGDDGSTVNFDYANEMSAYAPYIFTVPGDNYAEKWNLKGKTLVFSGTNAQIKASSDARGTITGSSYKFVGTTSAKSDLTDIYKLNTEGSSFVKTDGSVESFRAYFAPTTYQYATDMLSIGIGGGTTTGIADMLPTQQMSVKSGVYNLNGVKVSDTLESLPAGIYIINGKKTVK